VKSGRTATFIEIKIIVFFSEANFCEQNSYKLTQNHGLRFFYFSPFLLASAQFLFDARCRGVNPAAWVEKHSFGENSLIFQLQQWRIADKLENVVCEHGKP